MHGKSVFKCFYGIIDFNSFKEQVVTKEDTVLVHAIKTGFIVLGHTIFYKEVLHG